MNKDLETKTYQQKNLNRTGNAKKIGKNLRQYSTAEGSETILDVNSLQRDNKGKFLEKIEEKNNKKRLITEENTEESPLESVLIKLENLITELDKRQSKPSDGVILNEEIYKPLLDYLEKLNKKYYEN